MITPNGRNRSSSPVALITNISDGVQPLLRELLSDHKYHVTTGEWAELAADGLRSIQPDLVIIEIAPTANGADSLDWLRSIVSTGELGTIPLIVLSTDPVVLSRAERIDPNLAAHRYLGMPFDLSEFDAALVELAGAKDRKGRN